MQPDRPCGLKVTYRKKIKIDFRTECTERLYWIILCELPEPVRKFDRLRKDKKINGFSAGHWQMLLTVSDKPKEPVIQYDKQ